MQKQWKIIDGEIQEIREVRVHEFTLGDVEDPDLYAAQPLHEWANSEIGQWVMKNAYEQPMFHRQLAAHQFGYRYVIVAKLAGPRLTEWILKYGQS